MTEPVDVWWERRKWSKGVAVPYGIGTYRADWERYPALIRQYHPDLNRGITLTQIPPAADVFLSWQCDYGHIFVATPEEQRSRPGRRRRQSAWCPICSQLANPPRIRAEARTEYPRAAAKRTRSAPPVPVAPGVAFTSEHAPKPSSAAEGELRQAIRERWEFDLACNAIALSRPFFGRLEAWPDIIIPELRVVIEYDTTGRFGLEHVGHREQADLRKDRAIRSVRWEVIRIRCGRLQPLGPFDLVAGGVSQRLLARLDERLGEVRGELLVAAYRRADQGAVRRMDLTQQ
ncbi:MAG TPA: hypothetical protein VHZ81_12700 [Galbitalea sp.]|nr:hypothetical protein [Galbitalea sp.]